MNEEQPHTIGRYRVLRLIGQGGMGKVLLAEDPDLGRLVAIKVLTEGLHAERQRFLQEAKSAASLKHRNIVTIYDILSLDGVTAIIMEFVDGTTLADLIRTNEAVPLHRKLDLFGELAAGLEFAHANGVIHRDIKPANLMIDREGALKILDFGLARRGDAALTQKGITMGTPHYMSPEQINGVDVDRRSDVFSAGLVLYELLSGRRAFQGEPMPVMFKIVNDEPPPLADLCPELDPRLVAAVNTAIQKDPRDRYERAAAFAADVATVRRRLSATRAPIQGTELARRRQEKIEGHLSVARKAFEDGNLELAIQEAEHAVLLDAEDQRVIDVLESAKERLDQRRVHDLLSRAVDRFAAQDLDSAENLAADALAMDGTSNSAKQLLSSIRGARQQLELERDAKAAIDAAHRRFASGEPTAALAVLERFSPPHPDVTAALEQLRSTHKANQERAKAEDERRRNDELREVIASAEALFEERAFDDALRALDAADALKPSNHRVAALRARILNTREEAWARTKKVASEMARALQAMAAGHLEAADASADAVLLLDPSHREAGALKQQIAHARLTRETARPTPAPSGSTPATAPPATVAADPETTRLLKLPVEDPPVTVVRAPAPSPASSEQAAAHAPVPTGPTATRRTPTDIAPPHAPTPAAPGGPGTTHTGADSSSHFSPWLVGSTVVVALAGSVLYFALRTPSQPAVPQQARVETIPATTSIPASSSVPRSPEPTQPSTVVTTVPVPVGPRAGPAKPSTVLPSTVAATTSMPVTPPLGSPQPTIATSAPSSTTIATTSVPATTTVVPTFDAQELDRVLGQYREAMLRLDMGAMLRVYPSAPANVRMRLDALRKGFSQCDVRFQQVRIVTSSATTAEVTAESIESCKPKTAQPAISLPGRHRIHLVKTAAGAWVIQELFTQ